MQSSYDCIVIGGGPAGMMCAGTAAMGGCKTAIIEKNKMLGRKLLITGKGRCNVTNNCDRDTFMHNVCNNSKFLFGSFSGFDCEDTVSFFENMGVPLKTERGNRVFPVSDKAVDIRNALKRYIDYAGVDVIRGEVKKIILENGCAAGAELTYGSLIHSANTVIATGGKSYPLTGSTGDGYVFAKQCGHRVIPPRAALVPLIAVEKDICFALRGLSLRNVAVELIRGNNTVFSDFGEMVFTDNGFSGPVVLSASSVAESGDRFIIDLKPALDAAVLDKRILSDFKKYSNKNFANSLSDLLPRKLIPVIVGLSGIGADKKVNSVTAEERTALLHILKNLEFTVSSRGSIDEGIVTSGGVCVSEVNPKNMRSHIMRHLYFCGEVLDVDAFTGGFNLQIAFCTGYSAGKDMGKWE